MKYDCLIVDDEEMLSSSTKEYFTTFGVTTGWVADEKACLDFLRAHQVDLILLDINLGKTSGFTLCRRLRETTDIPILFISARTSDDDMVLALNIGGDDYIQKPYALSVLLAKVKAVLRRYQDTTETRFAHQDLVVDFDQMSVYLEGKKVALRSLEFKLLAYLVTNRNRVVPKAELFARVWGESFTSENTLNVHIRHLREKIEKDPTNPAYIKTVWGTGYIFEVEES